MIKELRIGNWVRDPLGEFMQVDQLGHPDNPDFIHARNENGFGQNGFEPIPLSPDILEKAGFEIHSKNSFWHFILPNKWGISMWMEDEPCAGFEEKGVCYYGENFTEVKYLHQLQNLYFCLCGQELEIDLSKH